MDGQVPTSDGDGGREAEWRSHFESASPGEHSIPSVMRVKNMRSELCLQRMPIVGFCLEREREQERDDGTDVENANVCAMLTKCPQESQRVRRSPSTHTHTASSQQRAAARAASEPTATDECLLLAMAMLPLHVQVCMECAR